MKRKKIVNELTDALISVCRQFGAAERTTVCCGDVNVAQCVALQFISTDSATMSGLAQHMGVTNGSATKLVDGMESKGWIVRTRDQQDGRRVLLQLSREGAHLAKELRDRTEQLVQLTIDSLDTEESKSLLRAMQLLQRVFEQCCDAEGLISIGMDKKK